MMETTRAGLTLLVAHRQEDFGISLCPVKGRIFRAVERLLDFADHAWFGFLRRELDVYVPRRRRKEIGFADILYHQQARSGSSLSAGASRDQVLDKLKRCGRDAVPNNETKQK